MVQQPRRQIIAENSTQSAQQVRSGGITANRSPRADARFMAIQSTGAMTDD